MRPIDISGFKTVQIPENLGPAPDLRWLPINQLVVDPRYQRDIARSGITHVRRIAEAFDWRLFSAVVVSPVPGGLYAIIDGQHRTTAASIAGQESVPCQIIQADHHQQARAFEAINGTKINVTRDQRYRAALAAGVPEALRLRQLTEAAGIRLLTSNPSTPNLKAGETGAHVALRVIADTWGDADAIFVLTCARVAAGEMPGVLRAPTFTGIRDAFLDYPQWLGDVRVKTAFETLDLDDLWRDASAEKARKPGTLLVTIIAARVVTFLRGELGGAAEDNRHRRHPELPFDCGVTL